MVAAFKQVNANGLAQGASATSLFNTTGGTTSILADVAASVTGSGRGTTFSVASAVSNFGGLTYTDGSQPGAASVLIVSGAPAAQSDFIRVTAAGTVMAKAALTTGKVLQIQDAGGTVRYASAALSDGIYWVSLTAVKGTTTSNGHVYAYVDQLVTSTWTSVSIGSDPGAVCNTGTVDATVSRFGKTSASGTFNVLMDRESISQGSTAKIDPPVIAGSAPTLTADSDLTVEPWAAVSTSCIASDAEEVPLPAANYTCTQIAGSTVTLTGIGNSRQISGGAPAVAGGTALTFRWQVTDSSGATSNTDTQTITVYAPKTFHLANGTTWQPMRIQSMA